MVLPVRVLHGIDYRNQSIEALVDDFLWGLEKFLVPCDKKEKKSCFWERSAPMEHHG